jgi:hypothetical protein
MSNSLSVITPKVLARALMVLRGKLIMPMLVNNDMSAEAAKKGTTIDVPIPAAQAVTDVVPSNTKPALVDTAPSIVQVPLDQWKMTSFHLTDKDMQQIDANEAFLPMQTLAAVDALASSINGYLFGLANQVPTWIGAAGTTPFASDASAAISARKILTAQKAPDDGLRSIVLDLNAEANALALPAFANLEQTGDQAVKIEGILGRKYGLNFGSDQQVPTHVKGAATGTSITVNGSNAAGAGSGVAGYYTGTLGVKGLTSSFTVGDRFTIAGDSAQYVVVGIQSGTTPTQVLIISPALQATHADGDAITLVNTHVQNLAFHRNAFAFAMRPLVQTTQDTAMGSKILSMTDPKTGVSMRLEVTRVHKAVVWELDVLYGGKLVRPELATVLLG